GRAIVHHEHVAVGPRLANHDADGRRLVVDGDDDDVVAHAATPPRTRAVRQPPRAMPWTSTGDWPLAASRAAAATRSAPSPPCWPKTGASDRGGKSPAAASPRSRESRACSQSSTAGSPLPAP